MKSPKSCGPNLFDFASSELSQDAFLSWLLSWADPEYEPCDLALHETALHFLDRLFDVSGNTLPREPATIPVDQQVRGLDILALVGTHHAVLIEDKTGTEEHSQQLERYAAAVAQMYPKREQLRIYLKTGEQSSYDAVRNAGYAVFGRHKLLEVLRHGYELGVTNAVLLEYLQHLEYLDDQFESFKTMPATRWDELWDPWQGFYVELQRRLETGGWGYVPNQGGGFMGFWWHDGEFMGQPVYLQLEGPRLCFKIEVLEKGDRTSNRNQWYERIRQVAPSLQFNIKKPKRFGHGKSMTVAELVDDYLLADEDSKLDIARTVEVLRHSERVLDEAASAS